MKNTVLSPARWAALWLATIAGSAALAQDTAKADPGAPPPPPPPPVAAAPVAPVPAPAEPPAAVTPTAPAPPTAERVKASEEERPSRRIDTAGEEGGKKSTQTTAEKKRREPRPRGSSGSTEPPFGDHTVAQDRRVREAVSILGATVVSGEVERDAVSVAGRTVVHAGARVGGSAVAVAGALESEGSIGGDAVSVLGGVAIDGPVRGAVVSVMGDVKLGPNAVVERDLVLVGGKLAKDPGAIVRGNEVNVPLFGGLGKLDGLTTWFKRCLFYARPLAFGQNLAWAWLVALSFLGFYFLLALLFRGGVEKGVTTLEDRPGMTVVASILTVLLSPVVFVLLIVTVVGLLVVPFLAIGVGVATLFGKAVVLAWLGRRVTRLFAADAAIHPAWAVLIGGAIVLLLYTVPVFGFLLFKLIGWIGLGVVVFTLALAMKRETPAAMGFTAPHGEFVRSGATAMPPPPAAAPPVAAVPPTSAAPAAPAVSADTTPRAGFMIRLAALALDALLIGILVGFVSGLLPRFLQLNHGPGGFLLALAAYAAVMWKHRGTTIGGIVCGLKVVRLDHRELDWATAIVRALGCFLSLVVAGLGFLWVAFDDEKQSWHDKIAGTTVVRVPKGVSLL